MLLMGAFRRCLRANYQYIFFYLNSMIKPISAIILHFLFVTSSTLAIGHITAEIVGNRLPSSINCGIIGYGDYNDVIAFSYSYARSQRPVGFFYSISCLYCNKNRQPCTRGAVSPVREIQSRQTSSWILEVPSFLQGIHYRLGTNGCTSLSILVYTRNNPAGATTLLHTRAIVIVLSQENSHSCPAGSSDLGTF